MIGELFDPNAELAIDYHYRPHWSQAGAIVFVTFRTRDSIPRGVLDRWHRKKVEWLTSKGIRSDGNLAASIALLDADDGNAFRKLFNRKREMCLDACHGLCLLRQPHLAKIVADSLLHFDYGRTGNSGHFWQEEPFDHLVRSNEQYEYLRVYIRDNSKKAGLSVGEFYYRRADS